nr:MAG: hypothetical protein DIU64_11125 [Caldicoprobacter oshimai]
MVRTELGPIELDIPRDRKGEYNPKIVPKYCTYNFMVLILMKLNKIVIEL